MARFGGIAELQGEIGGSSGGEIPRNLGDDPEGDGYAPRLTVGDFIYAMYHQQRLIQINL